MIDRIFINHYDANVENERFHKGFLSYMSAKGKSNSTMANYSGDTKEFLEFLKLDNIRVIDVHEEDLQEYLFLLQEKGLSVESVKRKFSSIKTFYSYLLDCNWIKENPFIYLRKSKIRILELDESNLTSSQISQFRKSVGATYLQRTTLLNLIVSTGLKMHCIIDLKWEQVDLDNNTILNVPERPDKLIQVFFDDYTRSLLIRLKKYRDEKKIKFDYIFIQRTVNIKNNPRQIECKEIRKYVDYIGNFFGIENFTPNDLRRTFAYILVENGMTKEEVSILLNYRCDKASSMYEQCDIDRILEKRNSIKI